MELLTLPLIGPFHLRSPGYNAITAKDLLSTWRPAALAVTALSEGELDDPGWQDTPELALPLSLVPWARRRGLPLHLVGQPSPEPGAEEDFRRYLEPFPAMRDRMNEVEALLRPVAALLEEPLTVDRIQRELVPALRAHQLARQEAFEDGPASEWLRARMETVAERIRGMAAERLAVLAPVEHLPFLHDELARRGLHPDPLPQAPLTPEARERSLLDYAFRGDAGDPGGLLAGLREIAGPEARYHEANLLLANGHGYEALELLEKTSHGDFSSPYFLPGYLLARLGQLRDLASRREDALRAYRGVLALDYAPAEALEAARSGLDVQFTP
jgi:hypothetical protein